MNASGITLALVGVLVIAQVVRGGALQRLGIIGCPSGSGGGSTPKAGGSNILPGIPWVG